MANVGLKMVKNKKEKSVDIWIYQDIGEGWFEGFTAKDFADQMKEYKDVDIINVYINSLGGDVFDGIAIYNILRRHKAEVFVEIDGVAASISSVIAMSGNKVLMAANAMLMIHNPWAVAIGDAATMRKAADDIDKVRDASILPAYMRKSNLDREDIEKLMDAETWMSAAEAEEWGFIDGIAEEKRIAASALMDRAINKYKYNPPEMKKEKPEPEANAKEETPRIDKWQRKIDIR